MAMGRQGDCQGDLVVAWSEMPRSPGHVFYDGLQEVLIGAGFDGYVEAICAPYYAQRNGALRPRGCRSAFGCAEELQHLLSRVRPATGIGLGLDLGN